MLNLMAAQPGVGTTLQVERRKSVRRVVAFPVWLDLGGSAQNGALRNISLGGAGLTVPPTVPLPGEFTMLLTRKGQASRRCRVIWRMSDQVGVEFCALDTESADPGVATVAPDVSVIDC